MTPAMADTAARRRYAGKTRLVELKQKAREGSAAHPKHDLAKSKTGEATVTRVDAHSGHSGASYDDGGAPATVMDKMTKQQCIKHHGIKAKLELH